MKLRKLASLLLVLVMALAVTAHAEIPSYVNVGKVPLVNEPVTLRVAVLCHDNTIDPVNGWKFKFLEEIVGIDIELEYFYTATKAENISLMMADGNLPDVMIGFGLDTVQLTLYGENDGLLLDIAPYLNEENAPNIMKLIEKDSRWLEALTNDKGHVFSLAGYTEPNPASNAATYRMFYNWDVMEAAGVTECPETLDEFLDMLRAVKAEFPDMVPFGGNYARYNATYLIMNALGFNYSMGSETSNQRSHETDIGLRNGEVTLFCYDKEVLPTYLEFMNTLYTEGLMEKDYYTLDKDTTKAHLSSGMYAVFSEVPGLYGGNEFGQQWWGGIPLTSEFHDTPFWPTNDFMTIGEYVISAETEHPELCVALADLFFSNDDIGRLLNGEPSVNDTEYLLGVTTGWRYNHAERRVEYDDFEAVKDQYTDQNYWRFEKLNLWYGGSFETFFLDWDVDENGAPRGVSYWIDEKDVNVNAAMRKELETFTLQFSHIQTGTWGIYETSELTPQICYFDADTVSKIADMKTLIDDYASQALAEFITGARPITEEELDKYFAELEALGADEYVQIYADYWEAAND